MAKNYYLYRDTEGSGDWFPLPWDLDLTLGRHFMTDDNILGDTIWADEDYVLGGRQRNVPISPSHPFMGTQELPGNRNWNRLIDALFEVPEFTEMFRRRLRTLADELLQPLETPAGERRIEASIAGMVAALGDDATRDTNRWGQFGARRTVAEAVRILESQYLDVRRTHFLSTHLASNSVDYPEPRAFSAEIPRGQGAPPAMTIVEIEHSPLGGDQDQEFIAIHHPGPEAYDISGWRLEGGVAHTFRPGTVLLSGTTLYVTPNVGEFRSRSDSPRGGEGLHVQGDYEGHLSSFGETVCLLTDGGVEIDCASYEGQPSPEQLFLRVTELHYHPAPPTAREAREGFIDADDFEFIEIANVSSTETIDLTGVRITNGVEFEFSGGDMAALGPGEVSVVVSHRAAFEFRYGPRRRVAGEYLGDRFSNGGERVKIEDSQNNTIADFTYDDDGGVGWPVAPDGGGPALEVIDVEGDYDDPANWRASEATHGTPGDPDDGEGPRFLRGDANVDGAVDIADAVRILLYLFQGGEATCLDACDADDDETVNITDAIRVLSFLFQGGDPIPAPYPAAGVDPTDDGPLGCNRGIP